MSGLSTWFGRRLLPLLATAILIAIAMASSTWWGPDLLDKTAWQLPGDLWGTLTAAQRLVHLDLSGLYKQPTGLISLPGAALILVPVVALIDAAGLSLGFPGPQNPHPGAWLLAGPYEVAISSSVMFAADSLAERLGLSKPKRLMLTIAEAIALSSVSIRWGHPEDAVAVALLLFGVVALSDGRSGKSAWLIGAAVAVQPLVLLALPVVLVVVERKRLAGYLARAAAPSVVLLGAAAAANWTATFDAVVREPNSPTVNHETPWTFLAPHVGSGNVSAGPLRVVALVLACACGFAVRRHWRGALAGTAWKPDALASVLWWIAVALAVRSVFEPVMVPYYIWPALAAVLPMASNAWLPLVTTLVSASLLTLVSQISQATWRGHWVWWSCVVGGLALTLFLARYRRSKGISTGAVPAGVEQSLA